MTKEKENSHEQSKNHKQSGKLLNKQQTLDQKEKQL